MALRLASGAWKTRAAAPLNILCIGDSVTEGTGVTGNTPGVSVAYQNRWVNVMISALQAHNLGGIAGGVGGFGSSVQDLTGSNPWSYGGGWGDQSLQSRWPGARGSNISVASGTLTAVLPPGTSIDVFYWKGAAATIPFTVTINGNATTVTPSTTGGLINNGRTNITAGMTTGGNNTVVITGNAGAQPTYVDGVMHYNGDEAAGARLFEGGHFGWSTVAELSDLNLNNDNNHYLARIPQIAPKLVIIFLQLNDYQNQIALATFSANYTSIISLLNGWATGVSVLMVGAYRRTDIAVQPITNAQYTAQLQTIAAGNPDYGFLDLQPLWNANGGTAALCPSDGVHPNNVGHALLGNYVASYLLGVFQAASGFIPAL